MISFNPSSKELCPNSRSNWAYYLDENERLVVHNKAEGNRYVVGDLMVDGNRVNDGNFWYSFDESSFNFHVVPSVDASCSAAVLKRIRTHLLSDNEDDWKTKYECTVDSVRQGINAAKNHRFLTVSQRDQWEYLLSFNRMVCKDGLIANHFGDLQFMRYDKWVKYLGRNDVVRWAEGNINLFENKTFHMIYPATEESIELDQVENHDGHAVFNAPFSMKTYVERGEHGEKDKNDMTEDQKTYIKQIADCFKQFIRSFENC